MNDVVYVLNPSTSFVLFYPVFLPSTAAEVALQILRLVKLVREFALRKEEELRPGSLFKVGVIELIEEEVESACG